jgi:uncharacterized peroxidase-related enzyme
MAHVQPVNREDLPEFAEYFQFLDENAGYVPNSFLTMARLPELFKGYMAFSAAVGKLNGVDAGLKVLMSHIASSSFGCVFCEAHTSKTAVGRGVDPDKVAKVWEFEQSDLFSEAERVALRFARDMGQHPNAVTAEHFTALREHFTDDQIVEMVTAVCVFGFWNRWNETMATDLEEPVFRLADALLSPRGWNLGRHTTDAAPVAP